MSQLVRHPEKPGRSGRVLVGATAIYIGVECHDDDPDGIVSYSKVRDGDENPDGGPFDASIGFVPCTGIQIFNPKLDYLVRPDWSWLRNMVFEFNVIPEGDRPTEPFVIADDVVIRPGSYEWTRYRVEADFAPERPVSATTARYREAHSTRKWPARGWRWTFHPQSETETNLLQVKVRYTFRK